VEKIRVLVANRPRLMRELVLATISDQPDIEVIGEIKDDAEIASAVAEAHPDVVIVALGKLDERPALCADLMGQFPQLKIVALAPERNSSMFIWSVVDVRSRNVECSEEGILSAVRGKAELVNG
jgi:DNA-binding NarL/FixJ family response regulator